jgi:hypothetical protein
MLSTVTSEPTVIVTFVIIALVGLIRMAVWEQWLQRNRPRSFGNPPDDEAWSSSAMPPPPDNLPYDYQAGNADPEPLIKLQPSPPVSVHRKWWIASAAFFVVTLAYVMFGTQTAIGRHFELFYMHFSFILATVLGAIGTWRWRSYYAGRRGGSW